MSNLDIPAFSLDEADKHTMSLQHYEAIASTENNPNYDPSTDPFYDPDDPKGKFNPNMGSACQSCGQYALTISETKTGMFKKKTVDTKLVCANCGKIQTSNLGLFL